MSNIFAEKYTNGWDGGSKFLQVQIEQSSIAITLLHAAEKTAKITKRREPAVVYNVKQMQTLEIN